VKKTLMKVIDNKLVNLELHNPPYWSYGCDVCSQEPFKLVEIDIDDHDDNFICICEDCLKKALEMFDGKG